MVFPTTFYIGESNKEVKLNRLFVEARAYDRVVKNAREGEIVKYLDFKIKCNT